MIPLLNKPNVDPADSDYPYGNIRDRETGQANGTPVNTEVYADFHQFFERLMAISQASGGDAPNGLPDNDYNGFQLFAALVTILDTAIADAAEVQENASWTAAALAGVWVNLSSVGVNDYYDAEYLIDAWGWVHLRGKIMRSNNTDGDAQLITTLPVGVRPTKKLNLVTTAFAFAYGGSDSIGITIEADGKVTPYAMLAKNVMANVGQINDFVSLDGLKFKL